MIYLWAILLAFVCLLGMVAWEVRRKHMLRWLGAYLRSRDRRGSPGPNDEVHLLLCVADHYEPKSQKADTAHGMTRVRHWTTEYPRLFGRFKDSDGRPPRYSFFFPVEEYEPEYLDMLAELCRAGFGEVEIHLHHHDDTADGFRGKIEEFKRILSERHGLLSRDRHTGELRYAFIHGNWTLCNSNPDGSLCGVDNELAILKETGCYLDMTFPSAPHPTQPPIVNQIYYAHDIPGRRASQEVGVPVGTTPPSADDLMMIQGPLLLDWRRRKWGILPRLENGCLQATQLPCIQRLHQWLRARVQVPQRPDWFFVKLHAHGASEDAHGTLLDAPMVRFHEDLAKMAAENPRFHFHYVTAREMYNLAKAAEAGFKGSVAEARDFELVPADSLAATQRGARTASNVR